MALPVAWPLLVACPVCLAPTEADIAFPRWTAVVCAIVRALDVFACFCEGGGLGGGAADSVDLAILAHALVTLCPILKASGRFDGCSWKWLSMSLHLRPVVLVQLDTSVAHAGLLLS